MMNFRSKRLSIAEVKKMDMVEFLSSLGFEPARPKNNECWYHSPFRNEKTASFKVDRRKNCWYDHGEGKGGDIIDFGVEYFHCTIGELLDKLSNNFSLHQPDHSLPPVSDDEPDKKIEITGDFVLSSGALLRYLIQRRIPVEIADRYCREVRYNFKGNSYYGIGFKNDLGGFEIRNPYFKSSSSPKGITTFDNGAEEVLVFEGFMDFLSFRKIYRNIPENHFDFVVLNSLGFFEGARNFMEKHKAIGLYLDRDTRGQKCSTYAHSLDKNKYKDKSILYKNHKDLNDWVMNFGKPQIKVQRQKLR